MPEALSRVLPIMLGMREYGKGPQRLYRGECLRLVLRSREKEESKMAMSERTVGGAMPFGNHGCFGAAEGPTGGAGSDWKGPSWRRHP